MDKVEANASFAHDIGINVGASGSHQADFSDVITVANEVEHDATKAFKLDLGQPLYAY